MGNEGSSTIESSLVFPIVIFFTVMIISISIFVYENVSAKLKFNNDIEMQSETIGEVEVEDEIIIENKLLFKNTWDALSDKTIDFFETVKKKIKRTSKIDTINDSDYGLEKVSSVLKGDAIWMKTDLSRHI